MAEPAVVAEPAPDVDVASAVAAGIDPVVGESAFSAGRLGPEMPGPEPEAEEAEAEESQAAEAVSANGGARPDLRPRIRCPGGGVP